MNTNNDPREVKRKLLPNTRTCLGCLGRAAIGLVIFLVLSMLAGSIYQASASASDLKKYPPPGDLYDVGDFRMHLYCSGPTAATSEGNPTVILEAGAGNPGIGWSWVQREVEGFSRVCSYDRPGFGWSDPASSSLSRGQVVTLLHQLLQIANVPGPYLLVGHSAGGEYIRAYAWQYPKDVIGMVFVRFFTRKPNPTISCQIPGIQPESTAHDEIMPISITIWCNSPDQTLGHIASSVVEIHRSWGCINVNPISNRVLFRSLQGGSCN